MIPPNARNPNEVGHAAQPSAALPQRKFSDQVRFIRLPPDAANQNTEANVANNQIEIVVYVAFPIKLITGATRQKI